MTTQEVFDKLDQLLSFHYIEQIVSDVEFVDTIFVVDFTSTSKFAGDVPKDIQQEFNCVDIRRALQSHSTKVREYGTCNCVQVVNVFVEQNSVCIQSGWSGG